MKQKILIVEDERALSEAYEIILASEGYDVKIAQDGNEALKITKDFEPQLILLDLRMPRMNGIEFLKHYKLHDEHPDVKVIVFSNLDTQDEIDEAYELGAIKYILKAWASPKQLVQIVKDTLKQRSV